MTVDAKHEHVLQAGSVDARLAKVYAESLLLAASRQDAVEATGTELSAFVNDVLDVAPEIDGFFASPVVGKKAKNAALEAALPGHASDLIRGLFGVLARNGRLGLLRGVAATYRQLLNDRAGQVPVKVVVAAELSETQREALTNTLAGILKQQPLLAIRVDPALLGGMVVQIGDRVIDTSVRTRLQTLRALLLDTNK